MKTAPRCVSGPGIHPAQVQRCMRVFVAVEYGVVSLPELDPAVRAVENPRVIVAARGCLQLSVTSGQPWGSVDANAQIFSSRLICDSPARPLFSGSERVPADCLVRFLVR
ncbi:hypothetical protein [Saccharopolyspora spinosa]|uniref:hypothetical protein n=1 Tax=Saccharopolyspora spinosa TaxID=60894 RepID=UPI001179DB3E|nr:hypothetical protein [Saccharopolyspora spinosa]